MRVKPCSKVDPPPIIVTKVLGLLKLPQPLFIIQAKKIVNLVSWWCDGNFSVVGYLLPHMQERYKYIFYHVQKTEFYSPCVYASKVAHFTSVAVLYSYSVVTVVLSQLTTRGSRVTLPPPPSGLPWDTCSHKQK